MNAPFFLVMLVTTLILFAIALVTTETITHRHYKQKADFYAHYPVHPGDIVFLGDSITDGACWDELFPGLPVKHRGINADTISGVLKRMDPVLQGKPAAIFLLIGTNDLPWTVIHNRASILNTYEKILDACRIQSPETRVFVQSILPRHPRYSGAIHKINAQLSEIARRRGYTYIDLFSQFADDRGGLRSDLTNDRLHLMAAGYDLWVQELRPYIREIIK